MSIFDRRPGLRWAVPAAAGALIVAGTLVGTVAVSADSGLPSRSAEELLVALQSPTATSVSGTVVSEADLGLPSLPTSGPSGTDLTSMLTGPQTLRLWSDGADRTRIALMGPGEETDIVRDGTDLWMWSSADQTVEHYVTPEGKPGAMAPADAGLALPRTPQEAAAQALAALDPTTKVTTSGAAKVAGRPVYELVLTPTQSDTLVARVVIAVDAETSVPLEVRVYSRQMQDPAFAVGFTSVDFGPVDAGVFAFEPPPGATVTEHTAGEMGAKPDAGAPAGMTQPVVVGTGWEQVVVVTPPAPTAPDATDASADVAAGDDSAMALMQALPSTSGAWGSGRVLSGTLFSVILADDGRIAVGAVPADAVGAALAAS